MRKMTPFGGTLLASFLLLTSSHLLGTEGKKSILNFRDVLTQDQTRFQRHGFGASLWSGVQAYRTYGLSSDLFPTKTIYSRHFANQTFEVGLKLQKDSNGVVLRRPFIVNIIGFGTDLNTAVSRRSIYFFQTRGYHVLTIPNPWSKGYLIQNPKIQPGDILREARMYLDTIQTVKHMLGVQAIEKTHIYGESYGAFMTPIILSHDNDPENRIIDGSATLLSPPLDIQRAFLNLDELLEIYYDKWFKMCAGSLRSLKIGLDHARFDRASDMSEFSQKCAPSMAIEKGFVEPLYIVAEEINRIYDLKKIPYWSWKKKPYMRSLRFSTVITEYLPQAAQHLRNPQYPHLSYWLFRSQQTHEAPIKIVYAQDDFLNIGISEQAHIDIQSILGPEQVTLLPWGGHLGYLALREWEDVLDTYFAPRDEEHSPLYNIRYRLMGLY